MLHASFGKQHLRDPDLNFKPQYSHYINSVSFTVQTCYYLAYFEYVYATYKEIGLVFMLMQAFKNKCESFDVVCQDTRSSQSVVRIHRISTSRSNPRIKVHFRRTWDSNISVS